MIKQRQKPKIHTQSQTHLLPLSHTHCTQGQRYSTCAHAHTRSQPDTWPDRHTQTHPITHRARPEPSPHVPDAQSHLHPIQEHKSDIHPWLKPELQTHTSLLCTPGPPRANYNTSLLATKTVRLLTSTLGARAWESGVGMGPAQRYNLFLFRWSPFPWQQLQPPRSLWQGQGSREPPFLPPTPRQEFHLNPTQLHSVWMLSPRSVSRLIPKTALRTDATPNSK